MEKLSYQVSNKDGRHDFTAEQEARKFAKALAATGWIGDTVRLARIVRHDDGDLAAEPEVIWSKTRS